MALTTNISFTRFYPFGPHHYEDDRLPTEGEGYRLDDGLVISGRGRFYVWYPYGSWSPDDNRDYPMPRTFRVCIDGLSPLLHLDTFGDGGYYYMMVWDIDTRLYPNGPHTLTVAPWLYFQTQEGNSDMVNVVFDNPESELIVPPSSAWNANLPALLFATKT